MLDCCLEGVGAVLGVGGTLGSRRFRFQNPAFGPFVTKASVQRDRPRRESGRWTAEVRRAEKDKMNMRLIALIVPSSATMTVAMSSYPRVMEGRERERRSQTKNDNEQG